MTSPDRPDDAPDRTPEEIRVPVHGGELAALYWAADAPGAPIAVLVHGITGNAMVWEPVARALAGDFEVVAPDLRGRGLSADLPGPYGIEAHADDVTALLRHFGAVRDAGAQATVLVGHSMGGFVATMTAAGPGRDLLHGLVLVDGGLAFPTPPGADLDAVLAASLGPTLNRIGRTFPDRDAVRAWWAAHPALGPWVDDPAVTGYFLRDLTGTEPELRSAVVPEAVRVDGGDVFLNERVLEPAAELPVPAVLLWATRGMQGQVPGLYDEVRLSQLGLDAAGIVPVEVPDTDHYSVLWATQGVEAVEDAVRAAAASGS
ncbi:alpha/beta hydrolase [Goekera deserti]|uniref:alpha/beta hydrolase n=1 Tax=Goekera deserti TaxID=2497753 RepID=UPI001F469FB3|nr:alpha/beta fold hydrolase [Goekera deserti]